MLKLVDKFDASTVDGALAMRADKFLETHSQQIEDIRRLFSLKLVTVPEDGEPVRRRVAKSEVTKSEWLILEALAGPEWRLVVTGAHAGEPSAEVAHEVILRAWPALQGWLIREREFLIWRHRIERIMKRWIQIADEYSSTHVYSACTSDFSEIHKKFLKLDVESYQRKRLASAFLLGVDMIEAENWARERPRDLSKLETAFIEASLQAEAEEKRLLSEKDTDRTTYKALFLGTAVAVFYAVFFFIIAFIDKLVDYWIAE